MADRERFSVYDHSTGNRTCYNADGTIDFLHEPPRLKYGEFTMPDDTAVLPHRTRKNDQSKKCSLRQCSLRPCNG